MGDVTGIAWTHRTYNHWEGCTKVGPGCDRCYAEARNVRFAAGENWGPGAPRRLTSGHNRNNLARWDRKAVATGLHWVFCSSLSDVFDNEVDPAWRTGLWDAMRPCENLHFQIVTKRIGNAPRMLPADWVENFGNAGIIVTLVDQSEADRDLPKLARTPAAWRGVSYEPALGPIDFRHVSTRVDGRPAEYDALTGSVIDAASREAIATWPRLDWLIVGGESGPGARPFDPAWARSTIGQGAETGTPVFTKQMGSNPIGMTLSHRKGEEPAEWPADLRVRAMPTVYDRCLGMTAA